MLSLSDIEDMMSVDMGMGQTCTLRAFCNESPQAKEQRDALDELQEYMNGG